MIGPAKCASPTDSLLYQIGYHPNAMRPEKLDLIANCAVRGLVQTCTTMPPEVRQQVTMRIENPDRFKRMPGYTSRMAKLFAIFAAIRHLPRFAAKMKERSWQSSWDAFFCVLVIKLDAYQAGRPLGSRSRKMLSSGRTTDGRLRGGKAQAAAAAAAAAAIVSQQPGQIVPIARAGPERVVPAYTGISHCVAHLCCIYML